MAKYIMALDAGTTSNRCILFDKEGNVCSVAQKEFTQIFPQPGWVEHDADEIFSTQLEVSKLAMQNIGATAAEELARAVEEGKVYIPGRIVIPGKLLPGGTVKDLNSP